MGLHADRALGYLYSVGEDGKFRLTEVAGTSPSYQVVSDIQLSSSGLKAMLYHEGRGIFVIADGEGWIYIYNQLAHPPELVIKL
jgi:hypothetical protein